jgi:hypothetical protein
VFGTEFIFLRVFVSHTNFVEKLPYMHMNTLKRKLVHHPKDWPWSSFSFYSNLKSGLIRVDPVH